jgi:hypothetical protein
LLRKGTHLLNGHHENVLGIGDELRRVKSRAAFGHCSLDPVWWDFREMITKFIGEKKYVASRGIS